ncbi:MAG TPA: OmpA family protein, partial [Parafilimonas sp.]|nr:OmpA family protein [Parafilimonas sp.]
LLKLLQDSKTGESVVLSEIHFEEGRHVLVKSSRPAITAMLDALKAMPSLQLEIQGHMCCDDALTVDGFDIDTKEFMLSYNRAKAVYDFLVQNGIDASRLTYKGYGTRKRLVSPEKTDKDRDKNRRVEFLITKK